MAINTCNKHVSSKWQVGDTLLADWDLIAPIIHFVNLLPNPLSIKHVYGHQDRNIAYKDMELEGQLNHDAYRHNPASHLRESTSPFPGNPVNLILRKRVVTTRHSEQIHFAASGPALINFMCTHFNWSEWTYLSIDWISHKATTRMQQHRPIQLTKLLHDQLPTATHLSKVSSNDVIRACPRCGNHPETFVHLLKCPRSSEWLESTI